MIYRENGQFKTTYRSDSQIFPILQDRIAVGLFLIFAFAVVPMLASDYLFRAILIPFLIISLAALGVNILPGQGCQRAGPTLCQGRTRENREVLLAQVAISACRIQPVQSDHRGRQRHAPPWQHAVSE